MSDTQRPETPTPEKEGRAAIRTKLAVTAIVAGIPAVCAGVCFLAVALTQADRISHFQWGNVSLKFNPA